MGHPTLFDERKAAQVAAYLLFRANGSLHVVKLMKLMYLAERLALQRYGETLTGDRLVAMQHGPVLSTTYDHMGGSLPSVEGGWESWISDRDCHHVALRNPGGLHAPEDDLLRLSDSDVEVLAETWEQFGHWDTWVLRDYTHSGACPEWRDPKGSSHTIPYASVFRCLGYSKEQAAALDARLDQQRALNAALSC